MTPRSLREKRDNAAENYFNPSNCPDIGWSTTNSFFAGYDAACADYAELVAPLLEALEHSSRDLNQVFINNVLMQEEHSPLVCVTCKVLAAYKEQVGGEE